VYFAWVVERAAAKRSNGEPGDLLEETIVEVCGFPPYGDEVTGNDVVEIYLIRLYLGVYVVIG
jgi:hypothetical protein